MPSAGVTAGVRRATDGLKAELRGQVVAAGLGERLAKTWRSEVFPRSGTSLGAAGLVWSKAAKIVGGFARGVTIRSSHGLFLAIPTAAAGRYGDGRKRITPAGWERRTGLKLRFVYRRGGPSLLVADNARLTSRGRAARNERRRGGAVATRLAGRATVPIFILVPQVTLEEAARRRGRRDEVDQPAAGAGRGGVDRRPRLSGMISARARAIRKLDLVHAPLMTLDWPRDSASRCAVAAPWSADAGAKPRRAGRSRVRSPTGLCC